MKALFSRADVRKGKMWEGKKKIHMISGTVPHQHDHLEAQEYKLSFGLCPTLLKGSWVMNLCVRSTLWAERKRNYNTIPRKCPELAPLLLL